MRVLYGKDRRKSHDPFLARKILFYVYRHFQDDLTKKVQGDERSKSEPG